MIKEVTTLQAMGALTSKEADSMSALKFRMNKADKAMWMDMKLYKNKELLKERNTKGTERWYNRAFFTHRESLSWNKEMVDTLHGWESRNLDLMSSRRWAQTGLSLECFWANQIRKAKKIR